MPPRALACTCGDCRLCKQRERYRTDAAYRAQKRARQRRYREMNLAAERERDRLRGFRETDPQKIVARNATRVLRKDQHDCERCGAPKAHAHHDDYSKPHDVRWLCRTCHSVEHRIYV